MPTSVALLGIPTLVVLVLVAAVRGWVMARSTGLEEVADRLGPTAEARQARPPVSARLVDAVGRRFERTLHRLYGYRRLEALDLRLERAGRPEGLRVSDYVRRQTGFTVLGLVVGAFFLAAGQASLAIVCAGGAVLWMPLWLRRVAANRQRAIARELPDFLDILAITVAAGLSLRSALDRVSAGRATPLSDEVQRTLTDMRLGRTRREALLGLRARNDDEALGSWVTSMLQAEELGSPLSEALQEIATEVRRQHAAQVRRAAAKAVPKIGLVVSLCIVPGALLLIVAALFISRLDAFQAVFSG